jgi:hypothetical protein
MEQGRLNRIALSISSSTKVRTAGRIEFVRDQGPIRRDIRATDFEWSPDALRNLAKILWAAQRAHSYSVSALRLFSKMPSSQFSPDGLLGGRGYIQSIRDLRKSLSSAAETLSGFTDTLYDEINADHWDSSETDDTKKIIENTEEIKDNPEAFVEEEYRTEGEKDFLSLDPADLNPQPPEVIEEEDLPDGEESPGFNQQAANLSSFKRSLDTLILNQNKRIAGGNSSIPVSTLPGPRVERIGPGESTYGWFNGVDALPSDDLTLNGFITDQPIYEDSVADGVTGYDNPTDGDSIRVSSDGYSWLPGSNNDKLMPFYSYGISDSEIQWMRENASPKNPVVFRNDNRKHDNSSWIWDDV